MPEVEGTFFRTGPNPQFPPRDPNHHWFAGDGMVHAFRVRDGKVDYFNRYVRTPKFLAEREAGKSLFGTFGNPMTTDPAWIGKDSGVANTNVIWHAGKLLALEEGHQPFELDPGTLASRGYLDYAGTAKRFTAHPKIDPETGELVFFGYMVGVLELAIAVSLIAGLWVRGGSIVGVLFMMNLLLASWWSPGHGAAFWRYFGAELDTIPLIFLFLIFFAADAGQTWGYESTLRKLT